MVERCGHITRDMVAEHGCTCKGIYCCIEWFDRSHQPGLRIGHAAALRWLGRSCPTYASWVPSGSGFSPDHQPQEVAMLLCARTFSPQLSCVNLDSGFCVHLCNGCPWGSCDGCVKHNLLEIDKRFVISCADQLFTAKDKESRFIQGVSHRKGFALHRRIPRFSTMCEAAADECYLPTSSGSIIVPSSYSHNASGIVGTQFPPSTNLWQGMLACLCWRSLHPPSQPRWLSGLMRSRVHSLWLLVDHCVLRNWDRILVRAVKGLISRAGMVSICPLLWQRDVKTPTNKQTLHPPLFRSRLDSSRRASRWSSN